MGNGIDAYDPAAIGAGVGGGQINAAGFAVAGKLSSLTSEVCAHMAFVLPGAIGAAAPKKSVYCV
jgi:thiamine pyrophosphate-dependent acetolactate synthase large subunit-like protein